ncbi:hypothetical protein DFH07DRAFT_511142 [Mycena maculata]|uniref:F-box domain-containing protein n=1 Tax=Mycena maculata TaxID=230809 RepID=A0AAD7NB15_9AGAR|nr:hypothetical protein DFH07DRAFT_511142 [Mycena maculata]
MASPFASRLGTNYCPTDGKMVEIEALLIGPSLRMKRLDDEIAEIQKALTKLTEERDSLGAYIGAHKALVSPVRRLPRDMIQDIFMACLPTHRMSAREAPVLLGRIYSSWRVISLSTPGLWVSLRIAVPGPAKVVPPSWNRGWRSPALGYNALENVRCRFRCTLPNSFLPISRPRRLPSCRR